MKPRRREHGPPPAPPGAPSDTPRLILGIQPVRAAIRAHGARLGAVLVESEETPRLAALARFARDQGVSRVEAPGRAALDRLAGSVQHQGAAAWAPPLVLHELEPVLAEPAPLIVALDRIQDPQNFGAVIRSAVALGASAVLWGEHASAPLGPATQRAAAGAIEFARLCRVASLPGALQRAAEAGAQVVGLEARAERPLAAWDLRPPTVLVVGSEHAGMTPAVRRACTGFAALASMGPVESLNASVAAAIALYEAKKQRS
ncbi:MAG TPA: RNA methyltransferase [Polyangiaceae bacterium]|nr:RNA methyltransferase [Polyangiaceae bacterium]